MSAGAEAEKLLGVQFEKKRLRELLPPALALFGWLAWDVVAGGDWGLHGAWRQGLAAAALAAAALWFGAARAEMSGAVLMGLGVVWMAGAGAEGWMGLLATVGLAAWKREGRELPAKATALGVGLWWLASEPLAADLVQFIDWPPPQPINVRQLALLAGGAVWLALLLSAIPLWLAAAPLAIVWYAREPGAALWCAAGLLAAAAAGTQLDGRRASPAPEASTAKGGDVWAKKKDLEPYRVRFDDA